MKSNGDETFNFEEMPPPDIPEVIIHTSDVEAKRHLLFWNKDLNRISFGEGCKFTKK
ncbi:MAG: hypothetical protein ACFFBD_20790 [Candidatus Hodarchaeota archaeon]